MHTFSSSWFCLLATYMLLTCYKMHTTDACVGIRLPLLPAYCSQPHSPLISIFYRNSKKTQLCPWCLSLCTIYHTTAVRHCPVKVPHSPRKAECICVCRPMCMCVCGRESAALSFLPHKQETRGRIIYAQRHTAAPN